MGDRSYIALDLKSYYATSECLDRGLDPITTNLVVADKERTEKTICLAVSPSLKAYGIPGRARLFEVVQRVKEVNAKRLLKAPGRAFTGSSYDSTELLSSPELSLDYIVATPRMARYIERSAGEVYPVYLKYVAPEDIIVYSIDEVLMDVTGYLHSYNLTARELASKIILDLYETTGITATAGIGTNLYLAKVAMDIGAKHVRPDEHGVRVSELDEFSYRRSLWAHRPITDFWRVGGGTARTLAEHGMFTMGDVARCSVGKPTDYYNEDLLYKLFGVNAELLIDHAWGWEPCTIPDIKAYKPDSSSKSPGQVFHSPRTFDQAKLAVLEMAESLARDLVDESLVTDQLVLTVGYDVTNLSDPALRKHYRGAVTVDRYGRAVPKHAHGTANLETHTASAKLIMEAASALFDRIVDRNLLARRFYLSLNHVIDEASMPAGQPFEQLDLYTDYAAAQAKKKRMDAELAREKKRQQAILALSKKYGKNAVLRGISLQEEATAKDRNSQVGGHKA